MELRPPALGVWSLSHWTTGKSCCYLFKGAPLPSLHMPFSGPGHVTGNGYKGDWKSSFHLGNHLRLNFPLSEKERIDMGVWGRAGRSSSVCLPHFHFFLKLFYWSIIDLQCRVSFWCTPKWFCYTYIQILFHFLFHYGLFQYIEYRSLCYRVGPCCLHSILILAYCKYPDSSIWYGWPIFFFSRCIFNWITHQSCIVILCVLWEHEIFHLYLAQPWSYSVPGT